MALFLPQKLELVAGSFGGRVLWPSICGRDWGTGLCSDDGGVDTKLEPLSSSGCRIPVATGGVSQGVGEEDGETDTGSTGVGAAGMPTRTRAESGLEPAGLPHDLQNLAPGFNCEPQCRHCSPD